MEQPYPVVEFEAEVGQDGAVRIPVHLAAKLPAGQRVIVRVVSGNVGGVLRARGVTEEEIEAVAVLQYEQRENVLSFLRAQGELEGGSGFSVRAAKLFGEGR